MKCMPLVIASSARWFTSGMHARHTYRLHKHAHGRHRQRHPDILHTFSGGVHMQGKVSHYVFVASAGAYVPDGIHAGRCLPYCKSMPHHLACNPLSVCVQQCLPTFALSHSRRLSDMVSWVWDVRAPCLSKFAIPCTPALRAPSEPHQNCMRLLLRLQMPGLRNADPAIILLGLDL